MFGITILLVLAAGISSAQSVKVRNGESSVKGEQMEGYEVNLDAGEADVVAFLNKYLKSIGKTKMHKGVFVIEEPTFSGSQYSHPLFISARALGNQTVLWMGLSKKEWGSDAGRVEADLKRTVYDIGVGFYKDQIQQQVDESERAQQTVERQQQKLTNQGKDLQTKLADNERDKVRLEKALESNKTEHESLLLKIEQNKHAQDSIAVAAEQIRKATEAHKERQRKVN